MILKAGWVGSSAGTNSQMRRSGLGNKLVSETVRGA